MLTSSGNYLSLATQAGPYPLRTKFGCSTKALALSSSIRYSVIVTESSTTRNLLAEKIEDAREVLKIDKTSIKLRKPRSQDHKEIQEEREGEKEIQPSARGNEEMEIMQKSKKIWIIPKHSKRMRGIRHGGESHSLVNIILSIPHPKSYYSVLGCCLINGDLFTK